MSLEAERPEWPQAPSAAMCRSSATSYPMGGLWTVVRGQSCRIGARPRSHVNRRARACAEHYGSDRLVHLDGVLEKLDRASWTMVWGSTPLPAPAVPVGPAAMTAAVSAGPQRAGWDSQSRNSARNPVSGPAGPMLFRSVYWYIWLRREAPCCIPGLAGGNLEDIPGSDGLLKIRKVKGTIACQETSGRANAYGRRAGGPARYG
jgi:hypothetical protein